MKATGSGFVESDVVCTFPHIIWCPVGLCVFDVLLGRTIRQGKENRTRGDGEKPIVTMYAINSVWYKDGLLSYIT